MGDGDVGIDNDDVLNDDLDHNGNGDVEIMVVLFLKIMNDDDDHVLWMWIFNEDYDDNDDYLNSFSISIKFQDGSTPLMAACSCGSLTIVKWLLKNGADVHLQNIVREVVIEVIVIVSSSS